MNLLKLFGIVLPEKFKRKKVKFMKVIVGGMIQKENKILMVQEAKEKCYGQWNFPMGHLDDGESIFEGAVREIFEETGCKVKLTKVLPILSCRKPSSLVRIVFLTELLEEDIHFDKSEILDVKWMEIEEIKKMPKEKLRAYEHILEDIRQLEANEIYDLDIIRVMDRN